MDTLSGRTPDTQATLWLLRVRFDAATEELLALRAEEGDPASRARLAKEIIAIAVETKRILADRFGGGQPSEAHHAPAIYRSSRS